MANLRAAGSAGFGARSRRVRAPPAAGQCRSSSEIRKIEQTAATLALPSRRPVTISRLRPQNRGRSGQPATVKFTDCGRSPRPAAIDAGLIHRSLAMMKSTKIALVVALAMFAAPAAMARPHSAHSHLNASHVTKTVRGPGYARSAPVGPDWGSECVTDEGQGRFFPCDAGP
jgi:hypothetical protein